MLKHWLLLYKYAHNQQFMVYKFLLLMFSKIRRPRMRHSGPHRQSIDGDIVICIIIFINFHYLMFGGMWCAPNRCCFFRDWFDFNCIWCGHWAFCESSDSIPLVKNCSSCAVFIYLFLFLFGCFKLIYHYYRSSSSSGDRVSNKLSHAYFHFV